MAQLLSANPPRPRIHYLSAEDLDRALDDPGLAALAASGWAPIASLPVEIPTANGPQRKIMMILWPPKTEEQPPVQRYGPWQAVSVVLLAIAIAIAAFAAGVSL
jgi:hypothetical protein